MEDENWGKCVGCGFLSWHREGDAVTTCFAVSAKSRNDGSRPSEGELRGVSNSPHCLREVLPVADYDAAIASGQSKPEAFLAVIRKERNCPEYFKLVEGCTPQEIFEMMINADIAKIQAERHGKDMDRSERQFDNQLAHQMLEAEKVRTWQEKQDDKRIADQKERDADQHAKQIERDKILSEANDRAQKNREIELAGIHHSNQIERDKILAEINHKKSVRLAAITAIVAALFGLGGFLAKEGYDWLMAKPS